MKTTAFIGGSLSFKGDDNSKRKTDKKKKNKKKAHKKENDVKHNLTNKATTITTSTTSSGHDDTINATINDIDYDDLTEVERRTMERRMERENIELRTAVLKSHRERVEEFNEKLSSQTEHNDIPRVRFITFINKFILCNDMT
jgi:protein FAM32A